MTALLVLTFLFFAGSIIGWGIELFWRRFFSKNNPEKKWINPGFLTGPYLPLYGLSLCLLFALSFIDVSFVESKWLQKLLLFILMAFAITVMEFIAGLIFIKGMKIKLWDYSKNWLNIQGIICPQYSFYWVILSGAYYFLVHPRILEWLYWFTNHLSFSFVVGFFYGVFTIDLCYTFQISTKIREYAKENKLEIRYENLKESIRKRNEEFEERKRFFFALKSNHLPLKDILREIFEH
ncbi:MULTISPECIES: putative ABC transporter permease [unclassified Treponema]|uniref:putative ABC transporter permease n=1 Tax=unclassified Treponema TaxID=2638727 RepID=UPI0025D1CA77|nr:MULTISPECIES: putative ABC transporter permease [unclassified Treponema]MBQ8678180.1 putative ABC transporter permease [Treponema sp.]